MNFIVAECNKARKKIHFSLILAVTLLIFGQARRIIFDQTEENVVFGEVNPAGMASGPILIDGNEELAAAAMSGTGYYGNPFIISSLDVDATNGHGIHLKNTDRLVQISSCNITGGKLGEFSGIYIESCNFVEIIDCNISDNDIGVNVQSGMYNKIKNNSIWSNKDGISTNGGQFQSISGNNISVNNRYGAYLYTAHDLTDQNNVYSYNEFGLVSVYGDKTSVSGSEFINNSQKGLDLGTTSNGCVIFDNFFEFGEICEGNSGANSFRHNFWEDYLSKHSPNPVTSDGKYWTIPYQFSGGQDTQPMVQWKTPIEDTDGDGLLDNYENYTLGTDPEDSDTDNDTMNDGIEIQYGFDPLIKDDHLDADEDGVNNIDEISLGTDPNDEDTDNDGMPDGWELEYGLNPLSTLYDNDFNLDPDEDGLINRDEYLANTDPNSADTDGDGLPDGWEMEYEFDPNVASASLDPDEDGYTNFEEFQNGTDPTVFNESESEEESSIPGLPVGLLILCSVVGIQVLMRKKEL